MPFVKEFMALKKEPKKRMGITIWLMRICSFIREHVYRFLMYL